MTDSRRYVVIVGGGIVGLAVALEVTKRFPHLRLLLLEKEDGVGRDQSGHNSGVIHSGVYYKPGSQKARLCVEGARALIEFCRAHDIPHQLCGKVIVATQPEELPRLEELRRRGEANGLTGLQLIGPEQLREIEPHATGLRALVVPSTGITDYAVVCEKYAELIRARGDMILLTSTAVTGLRNRRDEVVVETSGPAFSTTYLINCAGLFSDRIAGMTRQKPEVMIVPFRGEYYDLIPSARRWCERSSIPFPIDSFRFLASTSRGVWTAPWMPAHAVLAFRREGYRRTDFSLRDLASSLAFPGFWRMAAKHWRSGLHEFHRSFPSPRSFAPCSDCSLRCAQKI